MTNAARLTDYKKASVSAAFGAGVPVIKNHIGGAAAGQKAAIGRGGESQNANAAAGNTMTAAERDRDVKTNAAIGRDGENRNANAAAGNTMTAAERGAETIARATGAAEPNAARAVGTAGADVAKRDEAAAVAEAGADTERETGGTPPRASVLFVPSVADKIFPVSEKVGKKTAFFKIFSNNGRGKENQIRRAAGKNTISRNGGNGE